MRVKDAYSQRLNSTLSRVKDILFKYDSGYLTYSEMQTMVSDEIRNSLDTMFDWAFEIGLNAEVADTEQDGCVLEDLDLDNMPNEEDSRER